MKWIQLFILCLIFAAMAYSSAFAQSTVVLSNLDPADVFIGSGEGNLVFRVVVPNSFPGAQLLTKDSFSDLQDDDVLHAKEWSVAKPNAKTIAVHYADDPKLLKSQKDANVITQLDAMLTGRKLNLVLAKESYYPELGHYRLEVADSVKESSVKNEREQAKAAAHRDSVPSESTGLLQSSAN